MNYPTVQFSIVTPCDGDELGANIAHARSLGLPAADADPIRTLTVVANGPSARLFNPLIRTDTLAVNGALKLFTDAGTYPTYWACCDPQALVADFLIDAPEETIYLVASKSSPLVFQMLADRDVRVWDVDDHPTSKGPRSVACASSVTLVAMQLMRDAFGYRAFETYGWDGCFNGTEHHAGQHSDTRPDNFVQVTVGATLIPAPVMPQWMIERGFRFMNNQPHYEGGRTFDTTSTWAAEAQDAVVQMHYASYSVRIHGDGLIKAILESR